MVEILSTNGKVLNSNLEILNKFKALNPNDQNNIYLSLRGLRAKGVAGRGNLGLPPTLALC